MSLPNLPSDELLYISNDGLNEMLSKHDPQVPQRNFLWTTDYRIELPIKIKKSGPGSQSPYTLCEMWQRNLPLFGHLAALNYEATPNNWVTVSYRQYYNECIRFAKSLIALNIQQYTAVNIIGFNAVEWAFAFFGSIFGRYLPIGIYTTNGPSACEYIAQHSGCQVVILQDVTHLNKYKEILPKVPNIKYFIMYKGAIPSDLPQEMRSRVLTWVQFMKKGQSVKEGVLQERQARQKAGNCATFIYTSGTTGPPKAVMISHDNYTWIADAVGRRYGFSEQNVGTHRMLSMLPLSHVAAQLIDLIIAVRFGISIFFTDPSALQGNLIKFTQICRPTFFLCVPRVWEKIQEKLTALGGQSTGLKKSVAMWAKGKAPQGTWAEIHGKGTPNGWVVAKKLVFDKIKEALGLEQCTNMIFSAAPMKESTRRFFLNLNIYLQNCFGMSELAGPQTFTNPLAWDNYTTDQYLKEAGECIPGLELVISNPDLEGQGEMCLRGRNVFMGYYKDQKETRTTIDKLGFVHSGDIGMIMKNGSLAITGRIKELLITAGGQNVAPVLIENQINTVLPIFNNVIVIGDKMKYLTCLLCLKLKNPKELAEDVVQFIKGKGSKAKTVEQAIKCDKVKKIIEEGINIVNNKAISSAQRIVKFTLLNVEINQESGLLTPTLKLKRKIVNQRFEKEIAAMYQNAKL